MGVYVRVLERETNAWTKLKLEQHSQKSSNDDMHADIEAYNESHMACRTKQTPIVI